MLELKGNLFEPDSYRIMTPPTRGWVAANINPDAICITTNGFVKKNGECVMGKGCAKQATQLMPGLPKTLGDAIAEHGNRVISHGSHNGMAIVTFPVKPESELCRRDKANVVRHMQGRFNMGDKVPGWACVADEQLIEHSAYQLVSMARIRGWNKIILPRPGCGAGELSWSTVQSILNNVLDDRFYSITF